MPAPKAVNHDAPVEEIGAAIAPDVHDMMDSMGVADRPGLADRVVQSMATDITPDQPGAQSADLSKLFAEKINAVRREFGMAALDAGELEAEVRSRGGTAYGPAPDDPLTPVELTPEEVRERTRKARLFATEILSHPNQKKRATLEAIEASPPMDFFSPERATYRVNGVEIIVPEGQVKARGGPDGDPCGCLYVARLVHDSGAARRWEMMQQRILKETIIYGDEDQRPDYLQQAPTRGVIR